VCEEIGPQFGDHELRRGRQEIDLHDIQYRLHREQQ
jgi:hypothetical protein